MRVCPDCNTPYEDLDDHLCPSDQARLQAIRSKDPLIGAVIGDRYQIVSLVGQGGMGVVYKAKHLYMDRLVAIKMLHLHLVADAEAFQRFKQEARAISAVKHPHTVTLYDFGVTTQGQPYLVMDFIEGQSLRQLLRSEGALPVARAHQIVTQVVDALAFAHQAGVIHRDLKPENIMLSQKGTVTEWVEVVDFGISSLATGGNVAPTAAYDAPQTEARGSPPYMSPEQCLMMPVIDHRSDIYSLGIVLYEVLTGRLPYNARSALEMMDCHVSAVAMPLKEAHASLSPCEALTAMLSRALDKRPEKRQQTAEEFALELAEAVKRDNVRLKSLKHRPELMLPAEQTEEVTTLDELPEINEPLLTTHERGFVNTLTKMAKLSKASVESGTSGVFDSIKGMVAKKDASEDKDKDAGRYMFVDCPHCGEQVEKGIAFCLGCGRSLITTHEFSKVRAAQGVFTLPKSHDTSTSALPAMKARGRTGSFPAARRSNKNLILLLCLILGLAIVGYAAFSYMSKSPSLGRRAASEAASDATGSGD